MRGGRGTNEEPEGRQRGGPSGACSSTASDHVGFTARIGSSAKATGIHTYGLDDHLSKESPTTTGGVGSCRTRSAVV